MNVAIVRRTNLARVIIPLKQSPTSGGLGRSITLSKSWVVGWSQLRGLKTAANNTKASSQFKTAGDKDDKSQGAERLDRLKHLKRFFAQYPKFKYDPTKPPMDELRRMRAQFGWDTWDGEFQKARRNLYRASVQQPLGGNTRTNPKPKLKREAKKSSRPRDKRTQAELRTHLESFFAQYPDFKYDPTKPYMEEFYRMTNQFDWDSKGTPEQQASFQAARQGINDASVRQFNEIFGKDENDLTSWRNLCSVLEIADIPTSLKDCRKVVKALYINLCDLVDSPALHTQVEHFDSEEALSEYTIEEGKYFPLESALAGGLLKFLLRHILDPHRGKSPYARPKLRRRS